MKGSSGKLHVAHLVYGFFPGGLENVIVQLINGLPQDGFVHTVISLTGADPSFVRRIENRDVKIITLGKRPGQPFHLYPRMFRLLRELCPDVLHSCNLAALEFAPIAALAGVKLIVHAEHGWDMAELSGNRLKYKYLRKFLSLFVNEFVVVAEPLRNYMVNAVGVPPQRIKLIPNGVDVLTFHPRREDDIVPGDFPFLPGKDWIIGTVGRLVPVKNQRLLIDAFIQLFRSGKLGVDRLRLVIVGDGPLGAPLEQHMMEAGLTNCYWMPGARTDIANILRTFDCFVLPSLSEATSCTLQEAMATGLSIIATDVGGSAELLGGGSRGHLIASEDTKALADAIYESFTGAPLDENIIKASALAAVRDIYALPSVVQQYAQVFGQTRSTK